MHIGLIILGAVSCVVSAVSVYYPASTTRILNYGSFHSLAGLGLLLVLTAQATVGISCYFYDDPELKRESYRDRYHAAIAKIVAILSPIVLLSGLLNGVFVGYSEMVPVLLFAVWLAIITFIVSLLQVKRGRVSRYSKGSIFAAANKVGGAKNLFALRANDRMNLIDSKKDSFSSPIDKTYQPISKMQFLSVDTKDSHTKDVSSDKSGGSSGNSRGYNPNWDSAPRLQMQSSVMFFDQLFDGIEATPNKDLQKLVAIEPFLIQEQQPSSERINVLGRMGEDSELAHVRRSSDNKGTIRRSTSTKEGLRGPTSGSKSNMFAVSSERVRSHSKQRSSVVDTALFSGDSVNSNPASAKPSGNVAPAQMAILGDEFIRFSPIKESPKRESSTSRTNSK